MVLGELKAQLERVLQEQVTAIVWVTEKIKGGQVQTVHLYCGLRHNLWVHIEYSTDIVVHGFPDACDSEMRGESDVILWLSLEHHFQF